ncbi:MAG: PIG-L deacetylase family protein, partial [Chloroflexota bacterium]
LIASLRELGQNVTILTVFSGSGDPDRLTTYQREALGFGNKAVWPVTEAFNRSHLVADYPVEDDPRYLPSWQATADRLDATQADADAAAKRFWQRSSWYRRANIHNESLAGQPVIDDVPSQGAVATDEVVDAAEGGDAMASRRLEDERFAAFAEASIVWLDLPDAVFRGYEGDEELLAMPREDDPVPYELVRREIVRLEPQRVYLPLGVGNHVDHQLCREVGYGLLGESRRWVMPGPDYTGTVAFYEDFPYAWWSDFTSLQDLDPVALANLPAGIALRPEFTDVTDQLERKVRGISLYESQLDRLFGGVKPMANSVRGFGAKVAQLGGIRGSAERYWVTTRS